MDSRYCFSSVIFVSVAVYLTAMADAATESPTTLPPNFVPMIDGSVARPPDLPEVLTAPDAKGQICTLTTLEATIVIWPDGDEAREVRIEMPNKGVTASTTQNCTLNGIKSSAQPLLVVNWSTFQLCFFVSKNEKNWTVDQISFVFNSSDVPLGLPKGEMSVLMTGPNTSTDMQAPMGFSYRCWASKQLPLLPQGGVLANQNTNASLLLKSFQIQPYLGDSKSFGEEVVCRQDLSGQNRRRHVNTTVTVAVGSTLAVVAVVTVLGYALWRHIKIKAVGYDTMN